MPKLRDKDKTKEQLIKEITELRQRVAELERAKSERKQAEEALRESEEQLEAIFNEVSDGIILLDLSGKIIKINKRVVDVTGYTEKYIVGKRFNFFKNFPPQSIAKMMSAFTKTVAGQQVPPFEVIGYTKAGEKRIGEIYGSLLRKKGKAVGVLVVMEDITERKQAEEALGASEQKYRTILQSMEEGYYEVDLRGNFTFVNDALCQFHGRSHEELMSMNNREYTTPETAARIYAIFNKIYRTGVPAKTVDNEIIRKDGSVAILEESVSLIRDAAGKTIGFYGFSRDRTEQKKAEMLLRESEQKYRSILETMEEGYYEVDLAGNFTFCNEAECRIHGRSRDEMIGLNNREFSTPETAKRVFAIFNQVYRTGIPAKVINYEVIRKNGSVANIETSASLLRNAAGEPIGFYGISRDRTEEKRAETLLRESEQKYRTILETMEEGYYEVDLRGSLTFCNEAECRIHGRSRDEMMGLNNREFSSPETAKRIYPICNKVFRTGIPAKIVDYEIIRKDGSVAIVEMSVSLLRNAAGEPIGFYGISRDRTEEKKAEEALRQSEESYRNILELAPDSITISRIKDGCYLQVNDAFCRHTGYTPEEAVGRTAFDLDIFVDPADRERLVGAVRQHGQADGLEIQFRTKDGTILDDLVSARPVRFQGEDCQLVVATNINALKKAQQALRESEEKHRTILQTIEEGYYESDLKGNFTFCNETLCRMFGYHHDEMVGLHYRAYLSPEGAKKMYAVFNEVYRTGIPAKVIDYELIRQDGSVAMIETSASLLRNAAGKPIGFYGVSRDRTEQKKAEEALSQSEEKYRTILENMEDGYYEVDLGGNLKFFNEALRRIHRRSHDEMTGINNRDFSTPETAKKVYKIFNKVYRTGIPAKIVDYEVIRKDGSIAMVEESVSLLRNAVGEPVGFYGVSRDRTEQKKAEEALSQSEEKYRTILENIEDGYYEVDLAGNFTFFNDSMCRIQGYPRDELMGMNNREYMDEETAKKVYKIFNTVLRTSKSATISDWQITRKGGSLRDVESSVSLIRDAGGNPTGFRGILRDITERKRAEEALRESEEKYRSLVEFTEDSVYLLNRNKEYLFANETYLSRLGLPRDRVIGSPYSEFHSREDDKEFSGHIEQVLKTGRFVQYEHRSQKDDRYFLRTLSPVKEPDGHIEAVTVIAKDITDRKRAEAELVYMATHDALTGLPNRMLFNDRLTMALTQARRSQKRVAVMLLDLDYFKDVNDALGHSVGDQLLLSVGNRLRKLLRRGDTVARIGGDEFLLLLPEMIHVEYATTISQKILQAFQEPFTFDDHKLLISASIGVSIYPDDGEDTDTLMKNADIAMYRAKDKGRGTFERYAL